MRRLAVIAVLLSLACNERSIPTRFSRSYEIVQCDRGLNVLESAPCVTYFSASHNNWVDSARVVFNADNTVSWMLGTHTYWCPCYLGGCNTPCYHDDPVVTQTTGTYTIDGDSIRIEFADWPDPQLQQTTVWFASDTPDRVRENWGGPNWVRYFRGTASVVLRSN